MKLICRNNITNVYDDGDYYRVVSENQEDRLISKETEKFYPLVLVLKWGFEPVDIDYLNALSEE